MLIVLLADNIGLSLARVDKQKVKTPARKLHLC